MTRFLPTTKRRMAITLSLIFAPCLLTAQSELAKPTTSAPQQWTQSSQAKAMDASELKQWWRSFNDPLLTRLIGEALTKSTDVRSAQAKLRQSRAALAIAKADKWPTVSGSAEATRNDSGPASSSHTTSFAPGASVSWSPDLNGSKKASVQASQADYLATLEDLHEAQVALVAEIAEDYITLRSTQQRLQIARNNLASESETLQITEWRTQAGLTSELDVQQALSARDQTQASTPSLESTITQTEYAIEILLGATPGSWKAEFENAAPLPTPPDEVTAMIPADALRNRPDVRAAELRMAAESARYRKTKASRWPTLTLSGSFGASMVSGAFGGASATSSLVAQLTQTIFDHGRIRQQIKQQGGVHEASVVSYESTVLTALKDVESALIAFNRSRERLASLNTATEAARAASTLAKQRYTAGLIDFTSVLETQRTVLTLEDSLASTQADRVTALAQLYKALGGGWNDAATTTTSAAKDTK